MRDARPAPSDDRDPPRPQRRLVLAISRFVPSGMDPDLQGRAQLAVGIAWLMVPVFLLLALSHGLARNANELVVNVGLAALCGSGPIALRLGLRYEILLNTVLAVAFTAVVSLTTIRGAGVTVATVALAEVPLFATLLGGVRTGAVWALLSLTASVVVGVLGQRGLIRDRTPADTRLLNEHATLFIIIGTLFLVGALYELEKRRRLRQIEVLDQQRARSEHERVEALAGSRVARAEQLASLGRVAAAAAHEINNPLSYVGNNVEFVQRELRRTGASPEVEAALNEALEGVDRIRRMVAELKMQTRATDDAPRAVHLYNVIDAAIELATPHTRSKAVVEKKLGGLPSVVGSEARLTQLFLNLLVNSAQSIPEGRATENRIELRSARVGGFVEIEIEDTGEGIDPELVEAVSERNLVTNGFGEGKGFGLAMCESIVSEIGGRLELRRRTGHNLARVLLPVSETEVPIAPAPDDSEPLSSRPIGPASLLVIDDEPLVARALMRALKPHQVRHARGGREALGLLATGDEYDLILCDVMMPDLSGMDVYDELSRNRPELIGRLVFMTGGAFTDRAEHFRRRVSNPFLDKPLDLGKVRDLLARHARRRFAKGDEGDGRR